MLPTDFRDPYQRTVESTGSDPFSYTQFLARYRVTVECCANTYYYTVRRGRLPGAVFWLDGKAPLSPEEVIGRLSAQALTIVATPAYLDLSVAERERIPRYRFKVIAHNAAELHRVLGEEAFQALLYQTEIRF